MKAADLFVSVVAPLHDDEDIVAAFVDEVMAVLRAHYVHYELLLVDDGSTDGTVRVVDALLQRHDSIRLIRLSRRFGTEIAISAGLDSAIGDFVGVMLPELLGSLTRGEAAADEKVFSGLHEIPRISPSAPHRPCGLSLAHSAPQA